MSPRPAQRSFPFSATAELSKLGDAWSMSRGTIERLHRACCSAPLSPQLACVAISGSLSRMEYHAASDLDLLVVLDDRHTTISQESASILFREIWQRIDTEGLDAAHPKPGGVFSQCVSWRALTNPAVRGIVNEDMTTYGQRMQLLLDAQPVLNNHSFEELQIDLLNWYAETRVSGLFEEAGPFGWLSQDVQRYWRSIWSRAYWLHEDDADKSMEVNVKLRSSRAVIVAAFLHAIDVAQNTETDTTAAVSALQQQLTGTPLERLTSGLSAKETSNLLGYYQTIWHYLSERNVADSSFSEEIKNALTALGEALPNSVNS
ncbi:MAG: hypothetical protein P8J37_01295 [Fuerstiella sp.]|nr:hypothetical protein [Fuerstiella sp.]